MMPTTYTYCHFCAESHKDDETIAFDGWIPYFHVVDSDWNVLKEFGPVCLDCAKLHLKLADHSGEYYLTVPNENEG